MTLTRGKLKRRLLSPGSAHTRIHSFVRAVAYSAHSLDESHDFTCKETPRQLRRTSGPRSGSKSLLGVLSCVPVRLLSLFLLPALTTGQRRFNGVVNVNKRLLLPKRRLTDDTASFKASHICGCFVLPTRSSFQTVEILQCSEEPCVSCHIAPSPLHARCFVGDGQRKFR